MTLEVEETVSWPVHYGTVKDAESLDGSSGTGQIGRNLRRVREERNMSFRNLYVLTEIHPESIRQMEEGEIGIDRKTLSKLAKALRVEPDVLDSR